MRKRWKRLVAILGAAVLVVCQSEVPAKAAELSAGEGVQLQEETANEESGTEIAATEDGNTDEEKAGGTEKTGVEGDAGSEAEDAESIENAVPVENPETKTAESVQVSAVGNLRWTEEGEAVFDNPNEGHIQFEVHIFKDGAYPDGKTTTRRAQADQSGEVTVNMRSYMIESGTYTFQVVAYADGVEPDHSLTSGAGQVSGVSEGFDYTKTVNQDLLPAEKLVWRNDQRPGMAYFQNPNEDGAEYNVQVFCNGTAVNWESNHKSADYKKDDYIPVFLFEGALGESGTYRFEVTTKDAANGSIVGSSTSTPYEYTKPQKQLAVPEDVSWDKDGVFSCNWTGEEYLDAYTFRVTHNGKHLTMFGTGHVKNYVDVKIENGRLRFNLSEYLEKAHNVTPGEGDYVIVRATSNDITLSINSEWSGNCVFGGGSIDNAANRPSSQSSSDDAASEDSVTETVVFEAWKPSTPDQIKRYAACGKEQVNFTVSAESAYPVMIKNIMQGKMCYDSFEAVLGDYTIGRTYDILPNGHKDYKMDSKARITLNIPQTLQAGNRSFKMICVTEDGVPVILNDLDSDPATITFETDTYYAYALVYKDIAASK